eukprot:g43886.t1
MHAVRTVCSADWLKPCQDKYKRCLLSVHIGRPQDRWHPCFFLINLTLTKKRRELTADVDLKYDLKLSADGLSASANVYSILTELETKWMRDGAGQANTLMIPIGGDGRKTGATLNSVLCAIKVFAVDGEKQLVRGFPHPTSQEGFPVLISRCGEELEELKQSAELLQANYRVKELQFRGYKKKDSKFRCSICAKYYVYKISFQKHEEECRAEAEVDLDLVIGLSKERMWADEDFF